MLLVFQAQGNNWVGGGGGEMTCHRNRPNARQYPTASVLSRPAHRTLCGTALSRAPPALSNVPQGCVRGPERSQEGGYLLKTNLSKEARTPVTPQTLTVISQGRTECPGSFQFQGRLFANSIFFLGSRALSNSWQMTIMIARRGF